ncbi:hypothetical protein TrLO_g1844 [Triparma laevis f. longispina]|uniref:Uncharacterized protein n=1 Tax=Triparma laevis f. longispina TaxID=1714387 RepID=A0A9W7A7L6_9STRA|nr:hypothetical protein TrLO_g1844 [Triparma laevis f. longispina]
MSKYATPPFLPDDTLLMIRLASKPWSRVAGAFINEGVRSGMMIVQDGNDIDNHFSLEERRKPVTRVIFQIDIAKIGECACFYAVNLVVVDIPEGVKSIGDCKQTVGDGSSAAALS